MVSEWEGVVVKALIKEERDWKQKSTHMIPWLCIEGRGDIFHIPKTIRVARRQTLVNTFNCFRPYGDLSKFS